MEDACHAVVLSIWLYFSVFFALEVACLQCRMQSGDQPDRKHEDALCRRCGAQEENIEHLFHCQNFKEKPLNLKNLLKTDPTKLGKIFEKGKTFLS